MIAEILGSEWKLEHSIDRNVCLICIFIINLRVNEILMHFQWNFRVETEFQLYQFAI